MPQSTAIPTCGEHASNFLDDGITVAPGSLLEALQILKSGDTVGFDLLGGEPHVIATPPERVSVHHGGQRDARRLQPAGVRAQHQSHPGGNNAKLKIILDSRDGPEQRTKLGPLQTIPATATARAPSSPCSAAKKLSRPRPLLPQPPHRRSDSDPDIYCLAFHQRPPPAAASKVAGWACTRRRHVAGSRASVASFKGDNSTTSAGMVIGTDGDGVNDRAEFNVHVGMGLHPLETDT